VKKGKKKWGIGRIIILLKGREEERRGGFRSPFVWSGWGENLRGRRGENEGGGGVRKAPTLFFITCPAMEKKSGVSFRREEKE